MDYLIKVMLKSMILSSRFRWTYGYDDLSSGKDSSQILTLPPPPRDATLYSASNAIDRNPSTCTANNPIGGNSPDTSVWWRVDLGDIYSIHSIRILFKDYGPEYATRQRGRFAGFSIYLSNSTNREDWVLCYVDGPELPTLDFNTTCMKYGRYVIYYNERLKGVTYPEIISYTTLCEVIVHGCAKKGVYGVNCDKLCPINCQEQRCHIDNGNCLCKPGYTGDKCKTACPHGSYGLGCENKCVGHCKDNSPCQREFGYCTFGCALGWMGTMCTKACKDGSYGPACIYNCSGHCLNDVYCNKQTGHCDSGCNLGYTGSLCNTECSLGYFGKQCKELCSHNCLNDEICNRIDGVCTNGCKDGYVGKRCNKSCQHGYFGRNCSGVCSKRCISTCNITNGSCDCAPGWRETAVKVHSLSASFTDGDEKNHNAIIIGFSVSLTVNLIALAGIVFLLRRQILQNFRANNNSGPFKNVAYNTKSIEEVMENKNNYQEITASTDNNEYQVIQTTDEIATKPGNTYQNLAMRIL